MGRKLMLKGGKQPQMRKMSKRNWTKAKEREFLSVLAETCNVTEAARKARVSLGYAYKRRKSNAGFRAGWIEAIGAAYQRLELVLLERAFNGTEKLVKRRDGSEERMLEYSNQLGLSLLRMHRDTAADASREMPQGNLSESRERLFKKLMRLKERIEKDDSSKA
jgi:phage terminase small subunit